MRLDPNDPEVQVAVFGVEVERFLDSTIGQYLTKRATETANSALEQLGTVDPTDTNKIRALQNDVRVADYVITWLSEAIVSGDVAQQKLREHA
jgi:hypothetical protein